VARLRALLREHARACHLRVAATVTDARFMFISCRAGNPSAHEQ
jgi:hypothetical protein